MNPINIVCATDDKYVPYCGVMLTSLFENNKEREVNVYVMIDKPLSEKRVRMLAKLEHKYNQKIHYCMVDGKVFDKYPIRTADKTYLSIVTYYRLFAEELLPNEVKQVLYLDCDIIVDAPIGELFDMDWTGIAIGGVTDMCRNWDEIYERLQYDKGLGYFNAGVVLMNLEYWREHHMARQCFDYLEHNYDKVDNNDQDVLNVVMRNLKRTLPVTYNYQIQLRMPYFFRTFSKEMQEDICKTTSPKIIHYAAELKPWMAKYYSYPFYMTWQKYKRLSPWKGMSDKMPDNRKWATWVKRYVLWPLGIMLKKPELINKMSKRKSIQFFMLVTPRDVLIAEYAIRSFCKVETVLTDYDWKLRVYMNCLGEEQKIGLQQFTKDYKYVELIDNAAYVNPAEIIPGQKVLFDGISTRPYEGKYEIGCVVWEREFRRFESDYWCIVDADFEILQPDFIRYAIDQLESDDELYLYATDYCEKRKVFNTYSYEYVLSMPRYATWLCIYKKECQQCVTPLYYHEEMHDGEKWVWDDTGKFQEDLKAQTSCRYGSINTIEPLGKRLNYTYQYIHYGMFSKNASLQTRRDIKRFRRVKLLSYIGIECFHRKSIINKCVRYIYTYIYEKIYGSTNKERLNYQY